MGFGSSFFKKIGGGFKSGFGAIGGGFKSVANWGKKAVVNTYGVGKNIVNRTANSAENVLNTGLRTVDNLGKGVGSVLNGLGNPFVLIAVVGGVVILGPRILDMIAGKKR